MPYALDANDMKFFRSNGFVLPGKMAECVRGARDVLDCEARAGLPRLLNIDFHLRIAGRRGRFAEFEDFLAQLGRRRDRPRMARRFEIARIFAETVS